MMIGYYNVFYDGQLMVQGVRAYSEQDAIEQVYMKTGSASAYTGKARRLYSASRM
jgi:ribosomal protein L20A (L18A)